MPVIEAEKPKIITKRQPAVAKETGKKEESAHGRIVKLLKKLETKVGAEDFKATLGDFIRLLQLERELADEDGPREIRVTWVEPRTTSDSAR